MDALALGSLLLANLRDDIESQMLRAVVEGVQATAQIQLEVRADGLDALAGLEDGVGDRGASGGVSGETGFKS